MSCSRKRGRECAEHDHRKDGECCESKAAATTTAAAAAETLEEQEAPDYSSMRVWDKRYQDGVFVEWYCGFDHILPLFERFIPKDSRVLDVGCGDKPLAWEMREAGYTGQITGFDFSPTVIEKLVAERRSCHTKRLDGGVEFRVLDARELPFGAGSFDLVVDKGTVDAMLCDEAGKDKARAICREAARVVAPGGWFMIVSHIHPSTAEGVELLSETLVPALHEYSSASPGGREGTKEEEGDDEREDFVWSVDVHCGGEGDEDDDSGGQEEGGGDDGDASDGGGGGEGDEDDDGGGREEGGGDDGDASDGGGGAGSEGRGEHGDEHEHDDGDGSASGQLGPSTYMARKVPKRRTRSSSALGQNQQKEKAVQIRIHEY